MRISFFGGAGEVTGSCSLLETDQYKILVDCGMFQGESGNQLKNEYELPFNPAEITHVLITHAHLDHVGRLPLLVKKGFTGHFYGTPATLELAELIMEDALKVMQYDAKKTNRTLIYGSEDIAGVVQQARPVEYQTPTVLKRPGVAEKDEAVVTFRDAGHIFGSSFIEVQVEGQKIVFSGDIGNINVPIIKDTDPLPSDVDLLVCESTYGDRLHHGEVEREELIRATLSKALERGGTVMIPAFSLERTQELLYVLNDLVDRKHALPRVPVFLDSPLAIKAIDVYKKYKSNYDLEAKRISDAGDDLFEFRGLILCETREESKRINAYPGQKIIIAGSGMMNGGRILHHALRYLSDPQSTLLLVGYQSVGTLGRDLLDGIRHVDVLGERVQVRCEVEMLKSLSAHGDQHKLLEWMAAHPPKRVIFNHGDPEATGTIAHVAHGELKIPAEGVRAGMVVTL